MVIASVSILLDKRSQRKDNTYSVKLVVYFGRANKRYSLNRKISLTELEWEKINNPRLKQEDLLELKTYLESEKGRAAKIIQQLGNEFSYEMFDALFINNKPLKIYSKHKIYSIFEEYIESLQKEGRISTAQSYETALKSLKSYAPEITIKEITPKFLENYEKWMTENGRSITTVGIYLRSLRTILNIAKDKKLLTQEMYPFGMKSKKKYEIPISKNIKKALNIEDVKKIKDHKCHNKESEFSRDLWLFSLYCNGMNMADIFSLKYGDIKDDFFYFNRQKTIRTQKIHTPIEIYVSEPVKEIIDKWGNKIKTPDNYIFDIYKHGLSPEEMYTLKKNVIRQINGYMCRLGKLLNIDTKLTTYVARHSWATLLRNLGTSVEEISESLGHSNIATTKSYLDSFPKDHKKETANKLTSIL